MRISFKALLVPASLLMGWGCGATSEDKDDLKSDVGVERAGLRKGTPGAKVGDGNYCDNPAAPCAAGEGDCDGSSSCEAGLVCSSGKLKQFGFPAGDACVPAHCANKRRDADETQIDCGGSCGTVCATPVCRPNGTNGRCNSDCLCQAGEGDCDSSSECAAGLVCGGKLSQFGFAQGNACIAPHCTNHLRDADETQIDCGGSCGTVCATPVCSPNGTNGRCNSDCLCQAGEGDCDSSSECAAGLVCGGKLSQFGFAQGNACVPAHCVDRVRDANETAVDCGGDCGSVGCADGGGGGGAGGAGGAGGSGTAGSSGSGGSSGTPACSELCVSVTEQCRSNDDCPTDQYCDGSCQPAAALHATCSPGGRCGHEQARQLYCSASGTCELPLETYAECESSTIPCELGTTCVRGNLDATLLCRPPVRKGEYCAFNTNCEVGTFCDTFSPLLDRQCLPFVTENGSCTPASPCAPGLYCSANRVCLASPTATHACLSPALCLPNSSCSVCADDLYCDAGTCRRHASAGQDCTTRACGSGLRCTPGAPNQCDSPDADRWKQVVVLSAAACGLRGDGTVQCLPTAFETSYPTPAGTFSAISGENTRICGLRTDSTVVCWGQNTSGNYVAPSGVFTAVSSGRIAGCGIRADGTIACWGDNIQRMTTPPAGMFLALATGFYDGYAIRTDGTIAAWGVPLVPAPSGVFVAVSAGYYYDCALRADGSMACWGLNPLGLTPSTPPNGNFSMVSIGERTACAVRTDGTVVCWGDNSHGQATPPSGAFSSVSTDVYGTCGVRTDGTITCWGDKSGLHF